MRSCPRASLPMMGVMRVGARRLVVGFLVAAMGAAGFAATAHAAGTNRRSKRIGITAEMGHHMTLWQPVTIGPVITAHEAPSCR